MKPTDYISKGTFYSEDVGEIWNRHSNYHDIVPWLYFLFSKINLLKAGTICIKGIINFCILEAL